MLILSLWQMINQLQYEDRDIKSFMVFVIIGYLLKEQDKIDRFEEPFLRTY